MNPRQKTALQAIDGTVIVVRHSKPTQRMMRSNQILGIVVFAVGIVLLYFAYNASNAPLDQLANTVTGRFTSQTMWYLIGGIAAALGGGLPFLVGRRG